jgi:hypothetical protein
VSERRIVNGINPELVETPYEEMRGLLECLNDGVRRAERRTVEGEGRS